MPRPRIFRKISGKPEIRCFKPETEGLDSLEPIEITIDEFEAIRLRDYHDVRQKKSAEIMRISQPTFHRILTSARKKISKALIEGNMIIIVGGEPITDNKKYKCNICGFEWSNPKKEYDKCLDCDSENIDIITENEELLEDGTDELLERRSFGGQGMGAGPPMVCKCPNCGYESPKIRAVPCKNTVCPKCETPLCGAN
ncbi:DUF134 domain-containing protein [Methanobacterium sp. ACI-7]|uniref:DUF134 domain-containing protein n=1 Tax=unclassified Methanobacterium TaxID=2627676 RepID=UPI0039C01300